MRMNIKMNGEYEDENECILINMKMNIKRNDEYENENEWMLMNMRMKMNVCRWIWGWI